MFARKPYIRPPRSLPTVDASLFRLPVPVEGGAPVPKDARDMLPGDQDRLWGHVRALPCAR